MATETLALVGGVASGARFVTRNLVGTSGFRYAVSVDHGASRIFAGRAKIVVIEVAV